MKIQIALIEFLNLSNFIEVAILWSILEQFYIWFDPHLLIPFHFNAYFAANSLRIKLKAGQNVFSRASYWKQKATQSITALITTYRLQWKHC